MHSLGRLCDSSELCRASSGLLMVVFRSLGIAILVPSRIPTSILASPKLELNRCPSHHVNWLPHHQDPGPLAPLNIAFKTISHSILHQTTRQGPFSRPNISRPGGRCFILYPSALIFCPPTPSSANQSNIRLLRYHQALGGVPVADKSSSTVI